MMDINAELLQLFINVLRKKSSGSNISRGAVKNEIVSNLRLSDLAEDLCKPIIKKFEKRKVYSSFIDNICVA